MLAAQGTTAQGTTAQGTAINPNYKLPFVRENAPPRDKMRVDAVQQTIEGDWLRLRGKAVVETYEQILEAEEIDYNLETGEAEARGKVHFQHFLEGEDIRCDRAIYSTKNEKGKFYGIKGTFPAKIDARPGILVSSNPFQFQGDWAERLGEKYVLYKGEITSCTYPKPWWTLRAPKFDLVPNQRATMQRAVFRVKGVPVFYFPYFYKSLEKQPRRSGFLTPNFGNSSRWGQVVGLGYYWAINRSYDLTYRSQYFTERGFAHIVDFRGKPTQKSDFDFYLYGVNDRGLLLDDGKRRKEGGFLLSLTGNIELGRGWRGRSMVNYLSNFQFRQAFTQTFTEAVFSEVNSIGFVENQWKGNNIQVVFLRNQNFQSPEPGDAIVIRKLPQVEYTRRETRIWKKLPVWVSLDSSAGLVRRNQPLFQTRQYVERFDATPRATAVFQWAGFSLVPSFGFRGSYWGSSKRGGLVQGENITRFARDFSLEIIPPGLSRVFAKAPKWMGGEKWKHVIEPRATYRYVSGVSDFARTIRFDEIELLTNTNEVEVSLTNRIYAKRGGTTQEVLSWQVWHRRFFDPDFGGSLEPGTRYVNQSSVDFGSFAFFDQRRHYSPIASSVRFMPIPGAAIEYRTDYDPLRKGITNSTVSVDGRVDQWFVSAGHTQVRSNPILSPNTNQIRGLIGWGGDSRRGWSTAFFALYDYRVGVLQFANTQVTYNTDCCGFSVQYRRFSFGTRNENQFRVAFTIANLGSFGTLRRQERFF
ncbi:MAG: LPS assembly protein LptD [Bryobacter sp.]|nr:LPS assembly protein LptD [Bryobacter sp.]